MLLSLLILVYQTAIADDKKIKQQFLQFHLTFNYFIFFEKKLSNTAILYKTSV